METTLPAFTPIEESMFLTLRGRALDHRSPHPILAHASRRRGSDRPELAGRYPHRPAVIVADGLLAFLTQAEMVSLLKRLTGHFPFGEVAFNGYSRFAIWAAKRYHGTQSVAAFIKSPGFDDPREPERWDAGLKLVEEILLTREPDVAEFRPALRVANRLAARSANWSRRGTTVLHYRF